VGQLGDGNSGFDRDTPEAVHGGLAYSTVSTGLAAVCTLALDGAAYCWGRNDRGQLGDGNVGENRDTPGPVEGGLQYAAITAGDKHACALTTAGKAYCWGMNDESQLGDGNAGTDRDVPVPVEGDLEFIAITAGDFHTCGITAGHETYCWGHNGYGQLGDGNLGVDRDAPVLVSAGVEFIAINGGHIHTCAITSDGAAYAGATTKEDRSAMVR